MTSPHAATGDVVIPVVRRRQARLKVLASALQDGPVAVPLLLAGAAGLRAGLGGTGLLLAVAEVIVSAWLLSLTARELRAVMRDDAASHRETLHETAGGIDWPLLAGSALALVEVWHHWHATRHVKRPTLLLGLTSLALALGGRHVIARRFAHRAPRLVVGPGGVRYRGSRLNRFAATWDELTAVEHDGDAIRLVRADGSGFTLAAREHLGGSALVDAAADALRRHAPSALWRHGDAPLPVAHPAPAPTATT